MSIVWLALNAVTAISLSCASAYAAQQAAPLTPDSGEPTELITEMTASSDGAEFNRPVNPNAHPLTRADVDAWLDGFLPFALEQGDIAGAVVSIVKDGELLTSRGFGYADVELRERPDPALTLFRAGSISKLFTWTAVMQLVEQGAVDLDTDISAYIDFSIPSKFEKKITLRHLLTHTPGFEEKLKYLILRDLADSMPLDEYVKNNPPRVIYRPGSTPAYSNYGTALAGYIVERVSGVPFEDYLERNVFSRLGMTHSTFRQPLPAGLAGDVSQGYEKASDKEPKHFELIVAGPAGALSTTAEDMARFMIAHLHEGGPLFSPQTAHLMHDSVLSHVPPLGPMALGFYRTDRNGRKIISHGGDTAYFHSNLHLFLDEDVGVFISMNSMGDHAVHPIRNFLLDAFADRYFPAELEKAEDIPQEGTDVAHAAEVAGAYENSRGVWSNSFALGFMLNEFKVVAGEDGEIITPAIRNAGGAPKRWREVTSYVWRETDGKNRIAVRMENGKPAVMGIEPYAGIFVYRPVPAWRSSGILAPLVGVASGLLMLVFISWPLRAVIRARYGAPFPLNGAAALSYRLVRVGAFFLLAWVVSWFTVTILMLSENARMDGSFDALIRALQFAMIIPIAVLCITGWNFYLVWKGRSSWFAKLASLLIISSVVVTIWFGVATQLFSFNLNY